jgi:acetyl esterase/lipase
MKTIAHDPLRLLLATLTGLALQSAAWAELPPLPPGMQPPPGAMMPPGGMMPKPADTSHIQRKWLDVAYGKLSAAQKLDIYLPNTGKGPFPVIVAIHGGGFEMGDKADGQLNAPIEGVKRGYAVVSINYRLSREATFPAATDDVQAAIRFVKANAARYQLDAQHIATWGGSAGGNLSAWAGAAGHDESTRVQAVVDWFGPIDFLKMDEQFVASGLGRPDHSAANSPESRYLGQAIATVPDRVKAANPISHLTPDAPAFFIQHGSKDPLVPTQQSQLLAEAIKQVAGPARITFEIIEGAGHGGPQFETSENLNKVFRFLDRNLKPSGSR